MLFDYETLRIIWWGVLVILACGFAVTDGFDLGIGMLLPFVGKTDNERRVLLNTIGPTWEGNQTWLITLGGISFGAWSIVYAAVFSGLYLALILLLFALFMRPVGFDYRSKLPDPRWRNAWDWALFVGGAAPALVLSLAVGNLLLGLPFYLEPDFRIHYTGGFWELFTPFALLCGAVGVAMFVMHGAVYLFCRTEGAIAQRAWCVAHYASAVFVLGFLLAGGWIAFGVEGYRIVSPVDTNAANLVLAKTVEKFTGGWLANYHHNVWLLLAPLLALSGVLGMRRCLRRNLSERAFLLSSLAIIGTLLTAGGSMFPFILPSATESNSSLTVWDASGSAYSLQLLLYATVILLPIVVLYTAWVYRVLRGKVTVEQIQQQGRSLY